MRARIPVEVLAAEVIERLDHPDPDWRRHAACRNLPVNIFYPRREDSHSVAHICEPCPVRIDCLATALDNHDEFGLWGGIAIKTRWAIARHVRAARPDLLQVKPVRAKCGTTGGYNRHRDDGEAACEPCKAAKAAWARKYEARRRRQQVAS